MLELNKKDDCVELKNIKYKTMLQSGKPFEETIIDNNSLNLEKFLETEKNNRKNEPWNKLNKVIQIEKLSEFVETYSSQKKMEAEQKKKLSLFLKDSIDRKRLKKVKEVIYDKEKGKIIDIPGLQFNKSSKNFTLRNLDKRPSTVKSLPKKFNHTIKNKLTQDQSENGENDI
jgi:hypothetical protein